MRFSDMGDGFGDSNILYRGTPKLGAQPVSLEVRDCKICLGGEFAGNVDLLVACDADAEALLVEHSRLRVPGDSEPLDVVGPGPRDGCLEFTFNSLTLADLGEVPEHVTLMCGGEEVSLPCRLWGSIPLDSSRFLDPTQILQGFAAPAIGSFWTGFRCGRLLLALGLALLGLGTLLASSALRTHGYELSPELGLGMFMACVGAVLLGLVRVPYRQVRIGPERGTLAEVRGRDGLLDFEVIEESRRSLQEFSHVRIVERFIPDGGGDHGDSEVFYVFLEGPIAWQGEDRDVHLRCDRVELRNLGSDVAARRFAARVALSLGLQILDTSDTGC